MEQKKINTIRDKAVKASLSYPCYDILSEKGLPTKKRGNQIYSICYKCGKKNIEDHFSINACKNMYYCFGCGEGGGPAKLYSSLFNIPYIDAALLLAQRLGDITDEEAKMAFSSQDAVNKFHKGNSAIKKFEEKAAENAELKAPAEVCNLVYSALLKMPEFKLQKQHKNHLLYSRHLSEKDISDVGFFTYHKTFSIDALVSNIRKNNPEFTYNSLYGVPGFFFESTSKDRGVWHFKYPMPNCIGIPIKNADGQIVALQMRNMEKSCKDNKYFFVSSRYISKKNPKYGYGSSPSSPVAVIYPDNLKIPTFYVGEGVFKMLEIAREGAVAFSVQGVNSLSYVSEEIKKTMSGEKIFNIPTSLSGKQEIKLVIVFDADMYQNIQVLEAGLKAAVKFSEDFPGKQISFLLYRLEYGKGFDDMKFNCLSNNIDYRKKVRVVPQKEFTKYVKEAIKESDTEYFSIYKNVPKDIYIRRTPEYAGLLKKHLYDEKIRNILP